VLPMPSMLPSPPPYVAPDAGAGVYSAGEKSSPDAASDDDDGAGAGVGGSGDVLGCFLGGREAKRCCDSHGPIRMLVEMDCSALLGVPHPHTLPLAPLRRRRLPLQLSATRVGAQAAADTGRQ
jgi:hypothetical protein